MNAKTAIRIMLWILGVVMLFHLGILLKIIPYEITWGGRLKNDQEMYAFETVSLLINIFLFLIIMIKGGYLKAFIPLKVVNVILWIFVFLFALNTVGNILAKTNFEKSFAIITAASSFLIWTILVKSKKPKD